MDSSLLPNTGLTNAEQQWATVLPDGLKVVYTKTVCSEGFLYTCKCIIGDSIGEINWETREDLSQEQVERLPRFVDFLANIL
jgi:hypothetical protein